MSWKRYRIIKTDSEFLPWKVEERFTVFFFFHWWDTPTFAPPHHFEHYTLAMKSIFDNVKNPRLVKIGQVIHD